MVRQGMEGSGPGSWILLPSPTSERLTLAINHFEEFGIQIILDQRQHCAEMSDDPAIEGHFYLSPLARSLSSTIHFSHFTIAFLFKSAITMLPDLLCVSNIFWFYFGFPTFLKLVPHRNLSYIDMSCHVTVKADSRTDKTKLRGRSDAGPCVPSLCVCECVHICKLETYARDNMYAWL
ncbi:uncharacterized protein LOC129706213 isoform X2 [Leucoraja erinacea]|uniref:uncharacterized protein LOC129706213 isoform X2 n=1 Tax=Leucoraja erinaceus TaxID=7782 RepID=UPI00245479F7|nr:uncharacterized protein LOC129706213 isoform X2 [Leucoraja erinacea]